ncbi:hypothetical protein C0L77_000977 [Clostridium perfringens]|uniref:hypothetical protein n=1 Tax=Clostridium perfringens TaxID=1502 RepID=UPI001A2E4097|nr:hypothetical protein [Clostridium perfringens]MDH5085519.1 hypothetical protein [Clostridium perfringens]UBK68457.1 hypothetical protein KLF38_11295 [Clostridium perfringens]UBK71045.1 hypothetical protein KLF32_11670 [Clostridium perfringens]UBK77287.1 hypothetical protein KLF35_11435 [Clostridium perfringens]HAT4134792.1 hypothetical protein [Clostridium perfringens]
MKYIGSFFKANSLSKEEMASQLLFLSKESVNHIVLESRCGISTNYKNLKENFKKDEISFFKNNTPLICIYKKAKPNIYSSKYSKTWDDTTFKKDIPVSSNALMTLSLLRLCSYYEKFKNINSALYKRATFYKNLSKLQLEFYYTYLRNPEGFFVNKKNDESSSKSGLNISEKEDEMSYSDQALMMLAYYMYSKVAPEDSDSKTYEDFALQILNMFVNFKEELYSLSLDECCKIDYCLNNMLLYSNNEDCKLLVLDLSDFILNKYYESNSTFSNLETTSLLALNMYLSYKNTNILIFKDAYLDLIELFCNMFNDEKGIILKGTDKKEYKYSNMEICLYLTNLLMSFDLDEDSSDKRENIISKVYKNYIVNSGIVTSFPDAPNLDSHERYKKFSLKPDDLIDESMFRMTNANSPELTGLAPIFTKNLKYSTKKSIFTSDKTTFDSTKNMFIFFVFINSFIDKYIDFITDTPKEKKSAMLVEEIDSLKNVQKTNKLPKLNSFNSKTTIVPPDAGESDYNSITNENQVDEISPPPTNPNLTREISEYSDSSIDKKEDLDDKMKNILDFTDL